MPKLFFSKNTKYRDRSELFASYIIETNSTVRDAASYFGISKSTVHKDVTEKLKIVNPPLFGAVREILDKNKSIRHLRGGEATKKRYEQLKNKSNSF